MFPAMYFSRSLFLILLSFFVPSSLSDPESIELSNCSTIKYPCGDNLYEIYYPFRLQDSPGYCGHPEFDLICDNNDTLLTKIGGKEYRVNSIDYSTRTLHLTDQNFANQACPLTFTNTSFDFTLFDYSSIDTNLTVYINCSPGLGSVFSLHNFSCSDDHSFYKLSDEPSPPLVDVQTYCSYAVLVPMNQTVVASLLMNGVNDFYGALKQGFGLQWKVGAGWCKKCMDSRGICWNDQQATGGEGCFCINATSTNGTCVPIVVADLIGITSVKKKCLRSGVQTSVYEKYYALIDSDQSTG